MKERPLQLCYILMFALCLPVRGNRPHVCRAASEPRARSHCLRALSVSLPLSPLPPSLPPSSTPHNGNTDRDVYVVLTNFDREREEKMR